jgi:hypothetical protein
VRYDPICVVRRQRINILRCTVCKTSNLSGVLFVQRRKVRSTLTTTLQGTRSCNKPWGNRNDKRNAGTEKFRIEIIYTVCPTNYRSQHIFNHFTTNEDISTTTDTFLFISHTTNVLLFKFRCNIFNDFRIIKEIPGTVASGTPCIYTYMDIFWAG